MEVSATGGAYTKSDHTATATAAGNATCCTTTASQPIRASFTTATAFSYAASVVPTHPAAAASVATTHPATFCAASSAAAASAGATSIPSAPAISPIHAFGPFGGAACFRSGSHQHWCWHLLCDAGNDACFPLRKSVAQSLFSMA